MGSGAIYNEQVMKIIRNIILGTLTLLSMSGCKSLYGKYERPEVNTRGLIRDSLSLTDTLVSTDTLSFGNMAWREVFTDPQLQRLIQKALDNNPNLLNAALNIEMAQAQLKAAKLAFLPQFVFTPQGNITRFNDNTTKSYDLPVTASWNVPLFGGLTAAKRAAQVSLIQMQDYQLSVKTSLVSGVANLYYTLLMLDRQMELVQEMETLTKKTWTQMEAMKNSRMGYRSTAVQAAESNYYSVLTRKADLKRQVREMENSLSLLLGEPAQTITRGKLDEQDLPARFSTGVGIQLLRNRPDVHANEMALAACFYDVEKARANFYPNINISGTGGFSNGKGMINPGQWLLSAVASLTQPIFMNGKIVAGLRVAEAKYKQAYNTWQNSILTAGNEVSNALVLYNSSQEKSSIEAKQIEVLKKNVEQTHILLDMAGSTYLEVITAESNLLNVQLSKVADDFSKMQAVVNLYQALGGGTR
ncbi:efflux transporter, outer membrane factor lipoprotein, NodT family [Hallella bergensis DSM 17361]|uniref:Efflux transporter, outer membrane factor lipoprotein, NodT family n=2 Tax=Hallella bergensis TaxID=242750 RepID=D1PZ74_9BACT|nr:efflux transporter, outer membrane factor lipoprotein, NodT family [Hallella bergensis DSM 17361]